MSYDESLHQMGSLKGYLAPVGEKVMNIYVDVCRATKFVQRAQKINAVAGECSMPPRGYQETEEIGMTGKNRMSVIEPSNR